jgi:hypothetical protein
VSPTTLFLIEGGGGQGQQNAGMNWGDGFVTFPCAARVLPGLACTCASLPASLPRLPERAQAAHWSGCPSARAGLLSGAALPQCQLLAAELLRKRLIAAATERAMP